MGFALLNPSYEVKANRHGRDKSALPRRSCRQPAAARAAGWGGGRGRGGGGPTPGTWRGVEDDGARRAADMQAELGLEGVTDGEFRRASWHMDFLYQIGGVAKTDRLLNIQFKNEA